MGDNVNVEVTELKDEVKVYRALYSSVNSEVTNMRKTLRVLVLLVILLFALCVFGLLYFIKYNVHNHTQNTDTGCNAVVLIKSQGTTIEELEIENTSVSDYVTLPLVESISVTSKAPVIDLYNPIENKDLFEIAYIFQDKNGNVIYESDYILPGETIALNVSEYFNKNTSSCTCSIVSRYIDSKKATNGAVYEIGVSIKE